MEHLTEYQLFDYNSGEPDKERAAQIEAHLAVCPQCSEMIKNYNRDMVSFVSGFPEEPSETFWINYLPGLRQRMADSDEGNPGFIGNLTTAFAGIMAAAVIFALTAGWFPRNTVDLQFEEWFANNYTDSYIYLIEDDYLDNIYDSELNIEKLDGMLPQDNIIDIMESKGMEEFEEALAVLKEAAII